VTPDEATLSGLEALESLRAPHGVLASDLATGLYPTLYGRDSLWVLLLLADAAELAADDRVCAVLGDLAPRVLTALADLQGATTNDLVEEQPGRIPHEYHDEATPHALAMGLPLDEGRSYGGFDETFLFVLAYERFVRAFPGHAVVEVLLPHVARALRWVEEEADPDGDGLYEYTRRHQDNLLNQVWKDSFDAATHTGFDVPPQPLAWVEVQGYAYAALRAAARLAGPLRGVGVDLDPADLMRRTEELAALVDERFWLGPEDGLAMALDGRKRPVRMVASNPGHALWSGIVLPRRVEPLLRRMLRPDLHSAYGLRTLSRDSPFYAPSAYHRGAVWPFDNAVFALGLARHGHLKEAAGVARGVTNALERLGGPVECYVVLEPEDLLDGTGAPQLAWRHWPPRNRVQAFSAAALVTFGALLEVTG
jgi:glycogen debranching enzyme